AVSPGRRAVARRAAAAPRRAQPRGPRGARLMRPLDGVRVLDFTWVVAGPVTTRLLADLGAEVIKVERRGILDFGDRRGGLSGTLMRGKKSLVLDLNDARGVDVARRLVELAQLEAVASVVGPVLLERAIDERISVPSGNASQEEPGAPHGVYPCAGEDRWIAITVFTDAEWTALAEVARFRPDERFATRDGRLRHARELDALVASWTRERRAEDAMSVLQQAGVPAGIVADAERLCAQDPQLAAAGHLVDVPTPEGATVRLDGPPFLLSETPVWPSGPVPLLGEHTAPILSGLLGMDP